MENDTRSIMLPLDAQKKGKKVVYTFVSDRRDTSSIHIDMHHLNSPRRKDTYGSRLGNPEYRNKLFRPEVDAG
jgi:hypothetical protein